MYFCKFEGDSFTMKKIFWTIIAITALIFTSCSNKVNLFYDSGNTTVVYAMLDTNADTNFFKITKSFVGSANELAQDYSANNYQYDEIDVKFIGKFGNNALEDTIQLDTVSKWIPYDANATFYSGCYQTYYYTTAKLNEGETYKLRIRRKEDGVIVSAKATTINTASFQKPNSPTISFTDYETTKAHVEWKVTDANYDYKSTASYFEITGYFRYKECLSGSTDTTNHVIKWVLGSGKTENLYNSNTTPPYYVISYTPASFYKILGNNEHLKNNSPDGIKRWCNDFEFRVTAIGEELYNYYLVTNSTSAIQDIPNYTNVKNGMGIMSARGDISKVLPINILTIRNMISKFPQYGFVDPNDPNN